MNKLARNYRHLIHGTLSGFDRLVFRGYFRGISFPDGMEAFLSASGVLLKHFKTFALKTTALVKAASLAAATSRQRPIVNLNSPKEDKMQRAIAIAHKDQIREGLICVFKAVEPCYSFNVKRDEEKNRLKLVREPRKCQHLYHYYMHPELGLMHVRMQTWFPFNLQVWCNGREMLARRLDQAGIGYAKMDNAITWVENFRRAQALLWGQTRRNWLGVLNPLIKTVHPALPAIFEPRPSSYYWVVHQSEWATDLLFKSPEQLAQIYPELLRHAVDTFDSHSVMRYLGHRVAATGRVHGNYQQQVVTELKRRPEGLCVRHRAGQNVLKMYDKHGLLIRLENTLNDPIPFKVFRASEGGKPKDLAWRPMRKGLADMRRRTEVSHAATQRYAEALAAFHSPRPLRELIDPLCRRVLFKGKKIRAFRPLDPDDQRLLKTIACGDYALNGFRNRDLRAKLYPETKDQTEKRRASGRVTRMLQLLRAHALIKKVPHTHRYQITQKGREIVAALSSIRQAPVEAIVKLAS